MARVAAHAHPRRVDDREINLLIGVFMGRRMGVAEQVLIFAADAIRTDERREPVALGAGFAKRHIARDESH